MRKVRIFHIVNELNFDGTSKVVLDLCQLDPDKYEIEVLSLSKNVILQKESYWPDNVKLKTFDFYYDPDYSLKQYYLLFFNKKIIAKRAKEIIEYIEKNQPDIVHAHIQPRELIILRIAKINGIKLYTDHVKRITYHSVFSLKQNLLLWLYRRIYKNFHLIAVSKSVYKFHKAHNLVGKNKLHKLIENKINTIDFKPAKKEHDGINVIYVARFEKRKDHNTLLKAWSKIRTSHDLKLILIGDGDYKEKIHATIKHLNPKHPIHFTGNIADVSKYYQIADIAVFPSLNEGLPIALLEKMTFAIPVIVSDIEELKEIIHDNETGLVFKAGDADQLCEKIELLINNSTLRKNLGNNARHLVQRKYDLSVFKNDYDNIYNELLKNNVFR